MKHAGVRQLLGVDIGDTLASCRTVGVFHMGTCEMCQEEGTAQAKEQKNRQDGRMQDCAIAVNCKMQTEKKWEITQL